MSMRISKIFAILFLCFSTTWCALGQSYLNKEVSLQVTKKPLKDVLTTISTQGGFSFSYNATIINEDSLITITAKHQSVRGVLSRLLGARYQYKETEGHVIIQYVVQERWYAVSGYVTDYATGMKLSDVSVIERSQLAATLTDRTGYFRLSIKESEQYPLAQLTISKGSIYNDTNIVLRQGYDQVVNPMLSPAEHALPEVELTPNSPLEKTWLGKLLLSSGLRKQSANLGKFFVDKPYQFSLVPGIGSHGKLSGQVTNKFSLNVFGGYAAGVAGVEVGGFFNFTKKNMQYVQVAGMFNMVNGSATGVQIAGLVNKVADSVKGTQLSGLVSLVSGNLEGVQASGIVGWIGGSVVGTQVSGIANLVVKPDSGMGSVFTKGGIVLSDTALSAKKAGCRVNGVQIAGITNVTVGDVNGIHVAGIANVTTGKTTGVQVAGIVNVNGNRCDGIQVAGIANYSRRSVDGAQVAGIVNITDSINGFQLAVINIANHTSGYSMGIINIIRHGYNKLLLSGNDVFPINLSWKAGSRKFYSTLSVASGLQSTGQGWGWGYGVGREYWSRKYTSSVYTELSMYGVVRGHHKHATIYRFDIGGIIPITKKLAIVAGPVVSFCPETNPTIESKYVQFPPINAPLILAKGDGYRFWLGWKVGIQLF
jgi:hypothetical protein